MKWVIKYLYEIKLDKVILWCYLIWYFTVVYFYFEPSPKIWINSIGISAVIGTGLMLSVSSNKFDGGDRWQTFRLYLMPFCVSSFSALIKEHGFVVFISPRFEENTLALLFCLIFLVVIYFVKLVNK
jgi:hypothetical protein